MGFFDLFGAGFAEGLGEAVPEPAPAKYEVEKYTQYFVKEAIETGTSLTGWKRWLPTTTRRRASTGSGIWVSVKMAR